MQNILRKIKKWSKDREDLKNLISAFTYFLAPVPKNYLCRGDWTLGCDPMQFWGFVNTSLFPKIQSFKSISIYKGSFCRSQVPSYLWWREPVLKLRKIQKYSAKDYRYCRVPSVTWQIFSEFLIFWDLC